MVAKNKIIIDTDPGVDDVLALLLALSASPDDLQVLMISVTYGNVQLQSCLRNVVALFHVLEMETGWRKANGKPEGFESLKCYRPIVSVGADQPLEDEILMADHFHGADGLHGVHDEHPHLTPSDAWRSLFTDGEPNSAEIPSFSRFFTPSKTPAHKEMLRILKENAEDSISIVALGPMTNIAIAAAEDPETFLRVKELVVMGGAIAVPGNITPVAEFNTYADSVAAARVFALTSPEPESTMPPVPETVAALPRYPGNLTRRLRLTLFPLDVTSSHLLTKALLAEKISPLVEEGSPLAQWANTFLSRTMDKIVSMEGNAEEPGLSLHDPLCVWYMIRRDHAAWKATQELEDIRIETAGQWTRGMHVSDSRTRVKPSYMSETEVNPNVEDRMETITLDEVPGDTMAWLSVKKGNRVRRIIETPGETKFVLDLIKRVFGQLSCVG